MSKSFDSVERMFRHNGVINQGLLDTLTAEELHLSDDRGGESIFFLLAHLAHFRYGWLGETAPELLAGVRASMQRQSDGRAKVIVQNVGDLKENFRAGDEAMLSAVQNALNHRLPNRENAGDPTMVLARTVTHDAHHRGQMKTILRLHGLRHPELNRLFFLSWNDL